MKITPLLLMEVKSHDAWIIITKISYSSFNQLKLLQLHKKQCALYNYNGKKLEFTCLRENKSKFVSCLPPCW